MNYYKQGDAANADKIKAAFEKLGYEKVNVIHIGDYANERLFFFTENGKVRSTLKDCGIVNIIKTHPDYQELELPVEPKFKVGDWVVKKSGETFVGGLKSVQVKAVEGNKYIFTHTTTGPCCFIDSNCRLWTIKDAKDGDVLMTTNIRNCPFIYRKTDYKNNLAYYYAGIDGNGNFCEGCLKRTLYHFGSVSDVAPATKEQRDLLFFKMKEAGYQWYADKKELKEFQKHYDISNFHEGMPVLVRDSDNSEWKYVAFSHYREEGTFCACGSYWYQCIPFNDDTKHLLGTTDICPEEYVNW